MLPPINETPVFRCLFACRNLYNQVMYPEMFPKEKVLVEDNVKTQEAAMIILDPRQVGGGIRDRNGDLSDCKWKIVGNGGGL